MIAILMTAGVADRAAIDPEVAISPTTASAASGSQSFLLRCLDFIQSTPFVGTALPCSVELRLLPPVALLSLTTRPLFAPPRPAPHPCASLRGRAARAGPRGPSGRPGTRR